MVHCERCGSGFSPIRAATILYCPRCLLRDDVSVPLIVSRFKASIPEDRSSGSDQKGNDAADLAPDTEEDSAP